jgi:hypothetical protein
LIGGRGEREGNVQDSMRSWTRTSITRIVGRRKQRPHKKDGDQLEDAEGDELEKPVQAKNRLAPFGPLDGGICERDRHGGVKL